MYLIQPRNMFSLRKVPRNSENTPEFAGNPPSMASLFAMLPTARAVLCMPMNEIVVRYARNLWPTQTGTA